jgi:general transcription factor 3C polypeptide 3 (transcription factor C subunit 4)
VRGGGDEGEGGSASGSRSRKRRLDPALQGLMGEANLRYARGDKDTAIRMCMEVIKEDPSAPEPYQTLSTLYEENGDQEKALQFAMLAAHLSPQDADEWARLADMSLELDDVRQAVLCFRKAIHAEPENVRYHLARCGLLERLNDMRGALNGYKRLLALLPENAGADFLHASREAARLLHERDDVDGARAALATAVERHPQHVGVEDVNLLLELMISLGQYDDALDVLCRHGGVKFTAAESASREELERLEPEKQLETFSGVAFADNQPPPMEIKAKLVIVLVNLKANHLSQAVAKEVLALEADEYGDLMLDIAEAMAANHFHDDAVAFLRKLTNSQAYSQAEVWLKYGESLMAVNKVEEAELAYKEVMERAPNHLEARRTLSAILHKLGRPEEALRTLTQGMS